MYCHGFINKIYLLDQSKHTAAHGVHIYSFRDSTRTMCGENYGTDHQMLRSMLIFSVKKTQLERSYETRQDICSDPTEQTLKPRHPRGGARDSVWLSFEPEHSGHDILSATTPGKVNIARSTSVCCLSRLREGIRHHLEGWTVSVAEEIWMPRKVHIHDRKSAYRNDGQRQEWRGGLGSICYNKRCQTGVSTGSHAFLYLSMSNALRGFQRHGRTESRSNHASLQLHTSVQRQKNTNILVRKLRFADDSTLLATQQRRSRGLLMRSPLRHQSLA